MKDIFIPFTLNDTNINKRHEKKFLKDLGSQINVEIKMPVIQVNTGNKIDEKINEMIRKIGFASSHLDSIIMFQWIMDNNWKYVLELGVFEGHSTIPLLVAIWLNNGFLHSIDIVSNTIRVDSWLDKYDVQFLRKYWKFTKANSLELGIKDRFDMIYLDTSHKYNETILELDKFSKHTGFIFCHDYNLGTVKAAVDEFVLKSGWHIRIFGTPCGLALVSKAPILPKSTHKPVCNK